jgi:hypothetical protein
MKNLTGRDLEKAIIRSTGKKPNYVLLNAERLGMPNHWYMILTNPELFSLNMHSSYVGSCYVSK